MKQLENQIVQHLRYLPDAYGTVRALGIDKYPGEMAIVKELVQNADDAFDKENNIFPTYIKFIIKDDEIIVEHDGKPFSKPPENLLRKERLTDEEYEELNKYDFIKISRIGIGKTDEEMTGKFGTGFTSVFHITDNPRIESNDWNFEIHIGKEPIIRGICQSQLTFIHLPFRYVNTKLSSKIGAEIFDENKRKRFEEQILVESYKIIFFLSHITKIEVFKGKEPLYVVKKIERTKKTKIKNLSCKNVTISIQKFRDKNWKDLKEKWWIYSLEDILIPSQFKDLGFKLKQKVSLAISRGKSIFAEKFKIPNYSYFTFPVKETKFHFKYNASKFFTTTERSEFITKEGLKNAWNKWQINNLVVLLIKIISDFIITGKRPNILYRILPHPHEYNHEYDKYLIDRFREKIQKKNIKIFYNTNGRWIGPKDTYIGDKRLEEVLPTNEYRYFIDQKFIKNYKSVLEYYGVTSLSHKNLIEYLEKSKDTEEFKKRFNTMLRREKIDRLRLMLEYFDSSDLSSEEIKKLKEIDFLLTEDATLRCANYKVYFPSDEDMPLINPDDIVHHSIYTSKKSKSFLQKSLKIKKMGLHDLITDSFLCRLEHYDDKQKFDFVLYLVKRKKKVMGKKETIDELRSKLKDFLKLEINNPEDPDTYFDDRELKQIFSNKLNYLSREYELELVRQNIEWKKFFKTIGVKEIPHPEKIIEIASDISEQEFSNKNAVRAEKLFRFISKNLGKFNKEEKEELRELNEHGWIPTTKKDLGYPNKVYIDKKISHLVGNTVSFISFLVKKEDPFVQLLKMPTEPFVEDVVIFLLSHNAGINTRKDWKVDYRIYQYLNNEVKDINEELADKLRNNRTIWFRGKLWYPYKLFLKNLSREFGPNGEIRGYIHRSKLKDLTDFCLLLKIGEYPKEPNDYVNFLLDISEHAEKIEVPEWKRYIENTYDKIAYSKYPLSKDQKESLGESRIIIFNSYLKRPLECYLIRKTDKIYKDRIEKSGIVNVPFILEKDPKKERFYLSIGMKEIYEFIFQKRVDENVSERCVKWEEKLDKLIPWINGYGYHAFGDEGLPNLDGLKRTDVQKVSGLNVLYRIEYNGKRIVGNALKDFCCLEMDDNGKNVLYLDKSFDERNNKHIWYLSTLLTNLINPDTDVKRVEWIMLMNQYFRHGEISGINPYYPKKINETTKDAELEETAEETEVETEEEYEGEDEKVKEMPPKEEEITEEGEEKEKEPQLMGVTQISEKDDGLNPQKMIGRKKKRKKPKISVPHYRGGGYPTPHAINYEEERNWVREQANNFCQVCILFCENCKIKDVEGQCPCEIRKNAERALVHHHLEPFEGDPTKDVRGNLVVMCSYHHKQLDGINLKLGYLNNKVLIEERKDGVILTLYPKDKDESELKLRFSKDHFYEFQENIKENK